MKIVVSCVPGVLPLSIDTSSLSAGSHTLTIIATGADGATRSVSITLDIIRPLTFTCSATQSGSVVRLECNSDRGLSTLDLECQLDGEAFSPCKTAGVKAPTGSIFMQLFALLPRCDPCGD